MDELNRKIRHSKKKHDGLVCNRNSLKKAIEELKRKIKDAPEASRAPQAEEPEFTFRELSEAFSRAYRCYRVDGRLRMDPDTFFSRIRKELIKLISRELKDLRSARVQTMTWIRFRQDDDRVELAFNSRMTEVYREVIWIISSME